MVTSKKIVFRSFLAIGSFKKYFEVCVFLPGCIFIVFMSNKNRKTVLLIRLCKGYIFLLLF